MSKKNCLHCNKPLVGKDPRQKYCDRSCYDAARHNPERYKACEVCGKLFYANFPDRRFCSKKCRLEHGWNDKPTWQTFICEWCGEPFTSWTCRQNRFCSKKCAAHYGGSVGGRKKKPGYRVYKMCAYCGKQYLTNQGQIKHRGSAYCSRDCMYAAHSMLRSGENNPNWNGGTADPDAYGPNWGRQKRRAKKRDQHRCQVCGYKAGGARYLDVHHIIPVKIFDGDWKKANKLSNLICLCRICHRQVEMGKIQCKGPTAS